MEKPRPEEPKAGRIRNGMEDDNISPGDSGGCAVGKKEKETKEKILERQERLPYCRGWQEGGRSYFLFRRI